MRIYGSLVLHEDGFELGKMFPIISCGCWLASSYQNISRGKIMKLKRGDVC